MNHYSGQKGIQTKLQTTYGLFLAIIVLVHLFPALCTFWFNKKKQYAKIALVGLY